MTRLSAILAGTAVLALLGGTWIAVRGGGDDPFAPCRDGAVAGGAAAIGGPFTLVSETGETVSDADVLTMPSLVYFGYTYCPDICPLDAARNARAVDLLAEEGFDVQPVFITIDPARDTPEVLASYTDYLHPEMIGLTGSPEQIRAASAAYKTYYARAEGGEADSYLMNHSTFSYLVLPGHGFVEFFRGAPQVSGDGLEAEALAERAACFLRAA